MKVIAQIRGFEGERGTRTISYEEYAQFIAYKNQYLFLLKLESDRVGKALVAEIHNGANGDLILSWRPKGETKYPFKVKKTTSGGKGFDGFNAIFDEVPFDRFNWSY